MTSLPLTKKNLKQFMNAYAQKMESKSQGPRSEVSFASTKRSKSQGSNRSRSKSKPKGKRQRSHSIRGGLAKTIKAKAIKTIGPVVKTLESAQKRLALAKTGYFSDAKDVKADIPSMQKDVDQLIRELQLAVGAIRAGLGDRPIRMRLSISLVITTTVTTGVTQNITLTGGGGMLLPSLCSEWATCAALFEEYKCLGGEVSFIYNNPLPASSTALTVNSIPVIAYDADDNSFATSSLQLTQTSQHKLLRPCGPTGVPSEGYSHTFKWHTPKGVSLTAPSVGSPGTEWIPVAGVIAAGCLKFYHVSTVVTAIDSGAGFCYFDLEFRCRA